MEGTDIKERWSEYVEGLYSRDPEINEIYETPSPSEGRLPLEPGILRSEVVQAMRSLAGNKAPGYDDIPIELVRGAGEQSEEVIHTLLNKIWEDGKWPRQWKRSVYIPLYKKGDPMLCSNYRTIALISHTSKILLKIIQKRLEPIMERALPVEQAGFRKARGTRDHISNVRRLMETTREYQRHIYMCFIDYSKAFDCVDHEILWSVLAEMGVPLHLIYLMRGLYTGQEAAVRTEDGDGRWFGVEKGVRQGCILSPYLFNLYAEYIMRKEDLGQCCGRVRIGGKNITNLRYADDTTLLAESEDDLARMVERVKDTSGTMGLYLNTKKTKVMTTSEAPMSICCSGEAVETVTNFVFLGSLITNDSSCVAEVKRRIALGRKAMDGLSPIIKDKLTGVDLKVRLVRAMVFPVVMYGCESWTLKKREQQRIEAFELWCWRRILRIPWTAKTTNVEVLSYARPGTSLLGLVRKQQLSYFGHVVRAEGMEKELVMGKVEGSRRRGRQRTRWLDSMTKMVGLSLGDMVRITEDRVQWRRLVHEVTRGRIRPDGS